MIEEDIRAKILELSEQATRLVVGLHRNTIVRHAECESWLVQANNAVSMAIPIPNNPYRTRVERLAETKGNAILAVASIAEIFRALLPDIDRGLLGDLGNKIRAETFDDFLDHAVAYLKRNMKNEAGTIAGVVFEDTTRRIYRSKVGIDKGKPLETVINDLTRNNIITGQQSKQAKVASHVRTKATHAQWDEFDVHGVEQTIEITKRFIADHLGG